MDPFDEQRQNSKDHNNLVESLKHATEEDFVKHIRRLPNRKWADTYLNLLRHIISVTGLANDDARLVTSIPKGQWILPVSINHRYVLAAPGGIRSGFVGIIFGPEYEGAPSLHATTSGEWRFRPFRGEKLDTPFFLTIKNIDHVLAKTALRVGWEQAMLIEISRAQGSPFKKFHQPIVFRAAMESFYRQKLLDVAF